MMQSSTSSGGILQSWYIMLSVYTLRCASQSQNAWGTRCDAEPFCRYAAAHEFAPKIKEPRRCICQADEFDVFMLSVRSASSDIKNIISCRPKSRI